MPVRKAAYVDSKEATGHASPIGRRMAMITGVALVVGLVLMVGQVQRLKVLWGSSDFGVSTLAEQRAINTDGTCMWAVALELTNNRSTTILLQSVQGYFPGPSGRFMPVQSGFDAEQVAASGTVTATAVFEVDACPASEALPIGSRIYVNYSFGRNDSRNMVIYES